MIGKILNNRYRISEKVGSGGMATVYKGKDELLHRDVAIKILNPINLHDESSIRKFRREARAAGSLSHFNIVSVYDVGQQDDIYYIVMEYVNGKTLKDLINKQGKLSVEQSLNIASQICAALKHAHKHGVIHRDIKPHNIMLTPEGNVKVADFGIARAVSSGTLTRSKEIFGSVRYFSPEQASGQSVNEKSDIYSLGIVMYEMLSGKLPFTGDTPIAVALQHINREAKPLHELDASIPIEVSELVMKAINKDLEARYADISEFKTAIDSYLQGHHLTLSHHDSKLKQQEPEIMTRRANKANKKSSGKKQKKHRGWIIFAVVTLLIAAGAVWGYYYVQSLLDVSEIEVPDVVGAHIQTATEDLAQLGLRVEVVATQHHGTVAANHIIKQEPAAGSIVKQGRAIQVTLSEGILIAEVPDVVGMTLREAEVILFNAGFEIGEVVEVNSERYPVGEIISQNPRPLTDVKADTPVDLFISLGPEATGVEMPELVGLTFERARELLAEKELSLGTVTEAKSLEPAGIVIEQSVAAGEFVEFSEPINLTVSNGRAPEQEPEGSGA